MSTAIEWTRGDDGTKGKTWNPTLGCSRVSPGCDHCYAIRVAAREMQDAHRGLTTRCPHGDPTCPCQDGGPCHYVSDETSEAFPCPRTGIVGCTKCSPGLDWTGEVRCLPDRLDTPLRWRKPRRVFVDSMSDLFHHDVPIDFIGRVWGTMTLTPQHTYQVLTKRPQRMAQVLGGIKHYPEPCEFREAWAARWWEHSMDGFAPPYPLPNVWLGTSVENQRYADLRIPHLLATPAAVRFLSVEPMLGPVDLSEFLWRELDISDIPGHALNDGCTRGRERIPGIDWVITGGESGPGARPVHPDWVRSIRDQCVAAGVPYFHKQNGEWLRESEARGTLGHELVERLLSRRGPGQPWAVIGHDTFVRVGKKAAGRELDGRTWDEMPA